MDKIYITGSKGIYTIQTKKDPETGFYFAKDHLEKEITNPRKKHDSNLEKKSKENCCCSAGCGCLTVLAGITIYGILKYFF